MFTRQGKLKDHANKKKPQLTTVSRIKNIMDIESPESLNNLHSKIK